jgi:hypothetical protein
VHVQVNEAGVFRHRPPKILGPHLSEARCVRILAGMNRN